ncbi:BglII/BstYI family type II restriction endonuclease [Mesobacillus jeotgali]|uniref:BglII/BstYI family type II restriction endonuclease n=1 Tax=Mesobacillus jeotgali TaxID=129985 RepID=UPI000C85C060|nr:BglII/BstYI family type II restriction endonuclease [Mesobacillus jeotgali]
MDITIYSHNFAQEILSYERFKDVYDELLFVCRNSPLPIYKNKSAAQKKLDVVQQIIDSYLNLQLKTLGWEVDYTYTLNESTVRVDFLKTIHVGIKKYHIHLEVEFGNVASSYRNYYKLQLLNKKGVSDIGIVIVPTESLSKRIDSGVATFEKTVNDVKLAVELFDFPLLIIGLDEGDSNLIDLSSSGLTLKELQNKGNLKHELFVLDYVKTIRNLDS